MLVSPWHEVGEESMNHGSGVYLPGFDEAPYPRYAGAQGATKLLKAYRFDVTSDFQKQRFRFGHSMRADKFSVVEP